MLRRRARGGQRGVDDPALGFLDVNFGVFGIFLIVFAIRIILVEFESAKEPDAIVVLSAGEAAGAAEAVVAHAGEVAVLSEILGNPFDADEPFAARLREHLTALAADRTRPLQVEVIVLPDAFDAYKALSAAIDDRALASAETFIPVNWWLTPAASPEAARERLAEWSGAGGRTP